MGLCPRCRTHNPDLAAFCRKCGTRLAPPGAAVPASPPPIVYAARPAPVQRIEIVHKYKKSSIGCGGLLVFLLIGCCLWGSVYSWRDSTQSAPPAPTTPAPEAVPSPPPAPSNPRTSAFPFQSPPAEERQEYERRVLAKADSLAAQGSVQISVPRRTVFIDRQSWENLTEQEKKTMWETFREYFRIKTGTRDMRILSTIDRQDLGREVN